MKRKIIRRVINKRKHDGTLGETTFEGDKPKKVFIYKKSHVKNKKVERGRLGQTMFHEEYHVKHPKATEKEVYKKTNVKAWKKLNKKAKKRLYNKYYRK